MEIDTAIGMTHDPSRPVLDVVVPVYNEEVDLGPCVRRLHGYLTATFPYAFRITIADNASTDATPYVAEQLAQALPYVAVVRIPAKGRGRALRTVWSGSPAPVLAYMDVDLSTDLAALLPLVAPLISGHSDVAIGTRLARGSRVARGPKREIISRCYNLVLWGALAVRFSDAQCGFKAIRSDVAARLLPFVEDGGWFFDTELLVLAQRAGLRIHEVPVDWIDDADSRVDVLPTAIEDLKGVWRVGRSLAAGRLPVRELRADLGRPRPRRKAGNAAANRVSRQVISFAAIGVASTLAYLALFLLLRAVASAQVANAVALLITAVANTAANRRLTFGVRGSVDAGRHHVQGLVLFGVGVGVSGGGLELLHALDPAAGRISELAVLVAANAIATAVRFLALRFWVFGEPDPAASPGPVGAPDPAAAPRPS
jgi:glycosyltransferase involved in cell wall biosynthesis